MTKDSTVTLHAVFTIYIQLAEYYAYTNYPSQKRYTQFINFYFNN
jgi:hypothetical protein